MGKKQKHEEHENHERWLVSYADFITLLFATFTALYAISSADLAKFKQFSESVRDSFSGGGSQQTLMKGMESILGGKSAPTGPTNPVAKQRGAGDGLMGAHDRMFFEPGDTRAERMQKAKQRLASAIQKINQKAKTKGRAGAIQLSETQRGLKLKMDSRLLFDSGSAALRRDAVEAMSEIAERLKPLIEQQVVLVEGHTDNQPIRTVQFPSNWELSASRASTVVRFLVERKGYDPHALTVSGFADSRPVAANTTAEGRAQNRRIEILVTSENPQAVKAKPLLPPPEVVHTPKPPAPAGHDHKPAPTVPLAPHGANTTAGHGAPHSHPIGHSPQQPAPLNPTHTAPTIHPAPAAPLAHQPHAAPPATPKPTRPSPSRPASGDFTPPVYGSIDLGFPTRPAAKPATAPPKPAPEAGHH